MMTEDPTIKRAPESWGNAFAEIGRRQPETEKPLEIPTECPACHSTNIFTGSNSIKCRSCGVVTCFKSNVTDASACAQANAEQTEIMKDFRRTRGLPLEEIG